MGRYESWGHLGTAPIGQGSHLHGSVDTRNGQTFFTVKGPCGESHTMNAKEAKRLLLWLQINLDATDPKWRLTLDLDRDDQMEPPAGTAA